MNATPLHDQPLMRIVAGRHRGRALAGPGAAAGLRPTADRVRESLFNLLAHGGWGDPPPPEGRQVLDLFAGTGALGLEALSRGAASATFMENGRVGLDVLRRNIAALGAGATVLARDATRLGPAPARFDLVFVDPPYGRGLGERALAAAITGGWLAPEAVVVWEEAAAVVPPPGLTLRDRRAYGDTMLSFLVYDAQGLPE